MASVNGVLGDVVDDDRWIACGVRDDINFGLKPGGELKVETTLCDHRDTCDLDLDLRELPPATDS
jgi:hypothetical protein